MNDKSTRPVKTILIINDDEDSLLMLGKALKFSGYQVELALNEEMAFLSIDSNEPDLIILDIKLSNKRTNIYVRLRKEKKTRHIPIIICGPGDNEEMKNSNFGAVDYVFRPFSSERLFEIINQNLKIPSKLNGSTEN